MSGRERLLALLRLPPPPTPPRGDEQVRVFRAAPNYFRYRVMVWLATQAGAGIGLIFGVLTVLGGAPDVVPPAVAVGPFTIPRGGLLVLIRMGEVVAVAAYLVQLVVTGILLRLDFEQRWYMVSDRSLRIREGLLKVEEKTMTFANVQQMAIRQNPVQRWLRIADLEVRSAGGGKAGQDQQSRLDQHVGYFRGLADPAQIRDAIRERMKRHADAGLGDPDDPADRRDPSATPGLAALASAAALLRAEARALRVSLE
jgi:uncharacterized membrane protein YdbT with pleckstrin-like domain